MSYGISTHPSLQCMNADWCWWCSVDAIKEAPCSRPCNAFACESTWNIGASHTNTSILHRNQRERAKVKGLNIPRMWASHFVLWSAEAQGWSLPAADAKHKAATASRELKNGRYQRLLWNCVSHLRISWMLAMSSIVRRQFAYAPILSVPLPCQHTYYLCPVNTLIIFALWTHSLSLPCEHTYYLCPANTLIKTLAGRKITVVPDWPWTGFQGRQAHFWHQK